MGKGILIYVFLYTPTFSATELGRTERVGVLGNPYFYTHRMQLTKANFSN
jgi:hypothetical protein